MGNELETLFEESADSIFVEDGDDARAIVEIVVLWGSTIVALSHHRVGNVLAGDSGRCHVVAPIAGEFPLIHRAGNDAFLQFAPGFRGEIEERGERRDLKDAVRSGDVIRAHENGRELWRLRLDRGVRARLEFGALTFLVQRVRPADRAGLGSILDAPFLSFTAAALFLGGAGSLIVLVASLLGWAPRGEDPGLGHSDEIVSTFLAPLRGKTRPHGSPDAAGGPRAHGPEGAAGVPESHVPHSKGSPLPHSAAKAPEDVRGVLKQLASTAALDNVFGSGRAAELGGGMSGTDGMVTGDSRGIGALGLRGDGQGGGGRAPFIIGPGGDAWGAGPNRHGHHPGSIGERRGDARIGLGTEEVSIIGVLDPSVIQHVIHRHLAQIQYCYERELRPERDLAGKLVMHFVIEADGHVTGSTVKSSTLPDTAVGACVAERFGTMRFPSPVGGGTITVNYPLIFKTAGE